MVPSPRLLEATGAVELREGKRTHAAWRHHESRLQAGCGAAGGWMGTGRRGCGRRWGGGGVGPEALKGG